VPRPRARHGAPLRRWPKGSPALSGT
jgi:hypothetical protein